MTELAKIEEAIRDEVRRLLYPSMVDEATSAIMVRITPLLGAGVGLEDVWFAVLDWWRYDYKAKAAAMTTEELNALRTRLSGLYESAPASPPSEPQPDPCITYQSLGIDPNAWQASASSDELARLREEVKRLHAIEDKAIAQSEAIQTEGLSQYERFGLETKLSQQAARIAALEAEKSEAEEAANEFDADRIRLHAKLADVERERDALVASISEFIESRDMAWVEVAMLKGKLAAAEQRWGDETPVTPKWLVEIGFEKEYEDGKAWYKLGPILLGHFRGERSLSFYVDGFVLSGPVTRSHVWHAIAAYKPDSLHPPEPEPENPDLEAEQQRDRRAHIRLFDLEQRMATVERIVKSLDADLAAPGSVGEGGK